MILDKQLMILLKQIISSVKGKKIRETVKFTIILCFNYNYFTLFLLFFKQTSNHSLTILKFKFLQYSLKSWINKSNQKILLQYMEKVNNPWTKIQKIKGEGCLNQVMNRVFEKKNIQGIMKDDQLSLDLTSLQYETTLKKIKKKYKAQNSIGQFKKVFNLEERCKKLDEIQEWIEKILAKKQNQINEKPLENKQKPLDSNFFYLPLHSGTIFHEILKQCTIKDKQKNIGEYKNMKIKQSLDQINQFLKLDGEMAKEIL